MAECIARLSWPLLLSKAISQSLFSAKALSYSLLRLFQVMRNCAFILPGVLLLLASGNNEVGSLEMPRLGSGRGSTLIFNGHEAINNHPMPPKVAVALADRDPRMTEEAYAKSNGLPPGEVENRFAASGVLRCPGGSSSAQVTGARDVITTVAHAFRDVCKPLTSPDKCTFEYYLGAERRTVPLSATL